MYYLSRDYRPTLIRLSVMSVYFFAMRKFPFNFQELPVVLAGIEVLV